MLSLSTISSELYVLYCAPHDVCVVAVVPPDPPATSMLSPPGREGRILTAAQEQHDDGGAPGTAHQEGPPGM